MARTSSKQSKSGKEMSPFDYVNSINNHQYLTDLSAYTPFLINKQLSFSRDAISCANMMNIHHEITHKMQYDFLFDKIRPRKRRDKWIGSKKKEQDLLAVQEYYQYNTRKARQALALLTKEQLDEIKEKLVRGGI